MEDKKDDWANHKKVVNNMCKELRRKIKILRVKQKLLDNYHDQYEVACQIEDLYQQEINMRLIYGDCASPPPESIFDEE